MNILKFLPAIYFALGLIFSGVAYYLSLMSPSLMIILKGTGVDGAADGGALGFAILSGLCFVCCAYLSKKN